MPRRAAKSSAGKKLKELDSDEDASDASSSSGEEASSSEDGDSHEGGD